MWQVLSANRTLTECDFARLPPRTHSEHVFKLCGHKHAKLHLKAQVGLPARARAEARPLFYNVVTLGCRAGGPHEPLRAERTKPGAACLFISTQL